MRADKSRSSESSPDTAVEEELRRILGHGGGPIRRTVFQRFKQTISRHPTRTIVGILLTISFLLLLLTNPLLLLPFLQPVAYALQAFALSVGGIVPFAIVGSLLTLTAPKWMGNVLQFVGDKIIGGLINRVLFYPYLIVAHIAFFSGVIDGTKELPNKPPNYIDFDFKPGSRLGLLFWIPLTLFRIPLYLTHWIGKGLDRFGMLIAGEWDFYEKIGCEGILDFNRSSAVKPKNNTSYIKQMIAEVDHALAAIPNRVDAWIDSKIIFDSQFSLDPNDSHDPAILWPKAQLDVGVKYYNFMKWLGDLPLSTSMEEQLNRRRDYDNAQRSSGFQHQ